MFLPILLFAAAGALIASGTGSGLMLWKKAKREAAKQELLETHDLHAAALEAKLKLRDLEEEAMARGINPDEVIRGIDALIEGQVDWKKINKALED